jgi:hypothetical protein
MPSLLLMYSSLYPLAWYAKPHSFMQVNLHGQNISTSSPLLRAPCEGHGDMPQEEEQTMPTLQEMHRMTAASPASTASFWLLKQELAFRHFYCTDQIDIGAHYLQSVDNNHSREDDLASSGTIGISGFSESSLCPGEAQARGFEHGHDKKTSVPKGHHIQ